MAGRRRTRGVEQRAGTGRGAVSTIYVFVSSTFADMWADRVEVDRVLRELNEELVRPLGGSLLPVDLRWGIETRDRKDEVAKELHVLDVCLAEVQRSRPFFIGLVGERYGSVLHPDRVRRAARDAGLALPTGDPVSITELEIEAGVLAVPPDERRSLVALRRPLPARSIPAGHEARFRDDDPARVAALGQLRHRLREQLGDRVEEYTTPGELGAIVDRRLRRELAPWLAERRAAAEVGGWVGVELEGHFGERLATLVGRDDFVDRLVVHAITPPARDLDNSWGWWIPQRRVAAGPPGVVLRASPGLGKSTVMAALWERLRGRDDLVLLAHAAGAGPRSASVEQLLRQWVARLIAAGDDGASLDVGSLGLSELRTKFADRLAAVAARRPVVLLVDAVDQFGDTVDARRFTWLPEPLPPGVRFVVTGRPGPGLARLAGRADVVVEDLPPLNAARLVALVTTLARRYRRVLPAEAVAALVADRGGAPPTPLWARLAVEELLVVEDDVSRTGDSALPRDEEVAGHVTAAAAALPAGPLDLYRRRFADAYAVHGGLADHVLAVLVASRRGLRDADVEGVLAGFAGEQPVPLDLARLRRRWRGSLARGLDGRLDVAHAQARVAAESMVDPAVVAAAHRAIATHLDALPFDDPVRTDELLHHLLRAGLAERVAATVAGDPEHATPMLVDALLGDPDGMVDVLLAALDAGGPSTTGLGELLLDDLLPEVEGRVGRPALRRMLAGVGARVPSLAPRAGLAEARQAFAVHQAGEAVELLRVATRALPPDHADIPSSALVVADGHRLIAEILRSGGQRPAEVQEAMGWAHEEVTVALARNPGNVDLTAAAVRHGLAAAEEALLSLTGDRPVDPAEIVGEAAVLAGELGGDHSAAPELMGRLEVLQAELLRRRGHQHEALARLRSGGQLLARAEIARPGLVALAVARADARVREASLLLDLGQVIEASAALDHAQRLANRIDVDEPGVDVLVDLQLAIERRRLAVAEAADDDAAFLRAATACQAPVPPVASSRTGAAVAEAHTAVAHRIAAAMAWFRYDRAARQADSPLYAAAIALVLVMLVWYATTAAIGFVNGSERALAESPWWDEASSTEPVRWDDVWESLQGGEGLDERAIATSVATSVQDWVHNNLHRIPGIAAWFVPAGTLVYGLLEVHRFRRTSARLRRVTRWTSLDADWTRPFSAPAMALVGVVAALLVGVAVVAAGAVVGAGENLFEHRIWDTFVPVVTPRLLAGVVAASVVTGVAMVVVLRWHGGHEARELDHLDGMPGFPEWWVGREGRSSAHDLGEALRLALDEARAAADQWAGGRREHLTRPAALDAVRELVGRAETHAQLLRWDDASAAVDAAGDLMGDATRDLDVTAPDLDWWPLSVDILRLRMVAHHNKAQQTSLVAAEERLIVHRDDLLDMTRRLAEVGGESVTAVRAIATAVDELETAGATGLQDDLVALTALGGAVASDGRHVGFEVAAARLELVLARIHGDRGRRGSSFRLAMAARRRLRGLARRSTLVPPDVLVRAQRTGSAPTRMRFVRGPFSLVRYGSGYLGDLARTAWGFRVELAPLAVAVALFYVLLVPVARLGSAVGWEADTDALVRSGVAAAALAMVVSAAWGLCWLTPARRRRAASRRRGITTARHGDSRRSQRRRGR